MPEKPKPADANDEKPAEGPPDEQTWSEDQKKHRYYYDDAHGYEVYVPEEDEGEDEN